MSIKEREKARRVIQRLICILSMLIHFLRASRNGLFRHSRGEANAGKYYVLCLFLFYASLLFPMPSFLCAPTSSFGRFMHYGNPCIHFSQTNFVIIRSLASSLIDKCIPPLISPVCAFSCLSLSARATDATGPSNLSVPITAQVR